MDSIKEIRKSVGSRIATLTLESLFFSYLVLKGPDAELLKKEQLKKKLMTMFPFELLIFHKEYSATLSVQQQMAVSFYQGAGYMNINLFLRSGNIRPKWLHSSMDDNEMFINEASFDKKGTKKYVSAAMKKAKIDAKEILLHEKDDLKKIMDSIKNLKLTIDNAPRTKTPFYLFRGENDVELRYTKLDNPILNKLSKFKFDQLALKIGDTFDSVGFNSFSLAVWTAKNFMQMAACCMYRLKADENTPFYVLPYNDQYPEFEVVLAPSKFKVVHITEVVSPLSSEIKVKMYDIELVKTLSLKKGTAKTKRKHN